MIAKMGRRAIDVESLLEEDASLSFCYRDRGGAFVEIDRSQFLWKTKTQTVVKKHTINKKNKRDELYKFLNYFDTFDKPYISKRVARICSSPGRNIELNFKNVNFISKSKKVKEISTNKNSAIDERCSMNVGKTVTKHVNVENEYNDGKSESVNEKKDIKNENIGTSKIRNEKKDIENENIGTSKIRNEKKDIENENIGTSKIRNEKEDTKNESIEVNEIRNEKKDMESKNIGIIEIRNEKKNTENESVEVNEIRNEKMDIENENIGINKIRREKEDTENETVGANEIRNEKMDTESEEVDTSETSYNSSNENLVIDERNTSKTKTANKYVSNKNSGTEDSSMETDFEYEEHFTKINNNKIKKDEGLLFSLDVDSSTQKIIKRWLIQNPDHHLLGLTDKTPSNVHNDLEYLRKVLFALNPIIKLEKIQIRTEHLKETKKEQSITKGKFANSLGLVRVLNENETSIFKSSNISHSTPINVGENRLKLLYSPFRKDLVYSKFQAPTHTQKQVSESEFEIESESESECDRFISKTLKSKKKSYSPEEDKSIIAWVLKDDNVRKVSGNAIWKELCNQGIEELKGRSWHSLRNRFLKIIRHNIRQYNISEKDKTKIKIGAIKGTLQTKKKANYKIGILKKLEEKNDIQKSKKTSITENASKLKHVNILGNNEKKTNYNCENICDNGKSLTYNEYTNQKLRVRKLFVQTSFINT